MAPWFPRPGRLEEGLSWKAISAVWSPSHVLKRIPPPPRTCELAQHACGLQQRHPVLDPEVPAAVLHFEDLRSWGSPMWQVGKASCDPPVHPCMPELACSYAPPAASAAISIVLHPWSWHKHRSRPLCGEQGAASSNHCSLARPLVLQDHGCIHPFWSQRHAWRQGLLA